MTAIPPRERTVLHFFRSGPMPCPYIDGQIERKLFARLDRADADRVNTVLTQAGFRRSHDIIYRPVCPNCDACVPVRIPTRRFQPGRTMKRIARANCHLVVREIPAIATMEQFRLFSRYQRTRHDDSEMARMTFADYMAMVDEGQARTSLFEWRDGRGTLIAVMLADRLGDGFSAVYSFFDPAAQRQSLGTYMIMALVDQARLEGLPYVYLGYWIERSQKMAYKARFRPLEALGRDGWQAVD